MEEEERKEGKKEARGNKKSLRYLWILIIVLAIVLILLLFIKLRLKTCSDISCFDSAMADCQRASFVNEAPDASWLYAIEGPQGNFGCFLLKSRCSSCNINVQLLQAKTGTIDVKDIEGLDIDCSFALGYVGIPNSDLERCHGALREGLQDLMIKKMHAYILGNVGQIGEELNNMT